MGEVYRATDTHLGRGVAIKVLPGTLAHDVERVARLEHEARMLATLSHPNIAVIYGLEKSAGVHALVMELIEGPTLADRLSSGAIEQDEAIAIARQIADALSAAHEQGITHRDLKPSNVKVRPDGTVKVLDSPERTMDVNRRIRNTLRGTVEGRFNEHVDVISRRWARSPVAANPVASRLERQFQRLARGKVRKINNPVNTVPPLIPYSVSSALSVPAKQQRCDNGRA